MGVVIDEVQVDAVPPVGAPPSAAGAPDRRPPDMARIQLELRREQDRRERRWAD